jgi:hypothetical protein
MKSYSVEELAKKKFIISLREPVARMFSNYQDWVRICLEHGDIEGYRESIGYEPDSAFQKERGGLKCSMIAKNWKAGGMKQEDLQLETFGEFVDSQYGLGEMTRGYYRLHIQKWLEPMMDKQIKRSQIFIVNFQTLTQNTTDVMNRLASFIGLKSDWGKDVKLPASPQVKPPNTVFDCETFHELDQHYQLSNKNLYSFINNADYKPPQEPYFPVFDSPRNHCVNVLVPPPSASPDEEEE